MPFTVSPWRRVTMSCCSLFPAGLRQRHNHPPPKNWSVSVTDQLQWRSAAAILVQPAARRQLSNALRKVTKTWGRGRYAAGARPRQTSQRAHIAPGFQWSSAAPCIPVDTTASAGGACWLARGHGAVRGPVHRPCATRAAASPHVAPAHALGETRHHAASRAAWPTAPAR